MPIREATLEDRNDVVRLAGRFLATSAYGRLFAFEPSRIAQLVDLVLENGVIFVGEHVRLQLPPPAPIGERLRQEDEADQDIEQASTIVGFLAAVEAIDPYSGNRYADEIAWFVMPEARNGSMGPRLLASLERWARDKRLSFVKMVAPAESPDVAGFYQSIGYEALETSFVKRF